MCLRGHKPFGPLFAFTSCFCFIVIPPPIAEAELMSTALMHIAYPGWQPVDRVPPDVKGPTICALGNSQVSEPKIRTFFENTV